MYLRFTRCDLGVCPFGFSQLFRLHLEKNSVFEDALKLMDSYPSICIYSLAQHTS